MSAHVCTTHPCPMGHDNLTGRVLLMRQNGMPVDIPTFTWREAMLRARSSARSAEGRVTVTREDRSNGMRWVVRYRTIPVPINKSAA